MSKEIFGETVFSYTRAEALEDGVLVDLNEVIPIGESGFKFPVACTSSVWAIIDKADKNKNSYSSAKGVVWDILSMARIGSVGRMINASTKLFPVKIVGAGRKKNFEFKMIVHGGDNGEPVITIMMPEED